MYADPDRNLDITRRGSKLRVCRGGSTASSSPRLSPQDPRIGVTRRSGIGEKVEQIVAVGFEFGGTDPGDLQ